jgi:hypothetical protein
MMRLAAILAVWLVALAALAASEHARPNGGLPVVKTAIPVAHDHPISWRLNSVCTIDEHKTQEIV